MSNIYFKYKTTIYYSDTVWFKESNFPVKFTKFEITVKNITYNGLYKKKLDYFIINHKLTLIWFYNPLEAILNYLSIFNFKLKYSSLIWNKKLN